ncbi:MAG: 2Fe-2S iron-sulfur cluster binding domain-containing protein, partial [bacterium]|nr:2Fe-2S iron-sulfur cluster binding domain-containing protein [bacterium]
MPDNCKVSFLPEDKTVEVRPGTTILAAAGQVGVFVNSLCGGDGVCGRCGVIVREGTVTGGSTDFFSHEQIQQGHILACEGRIESDVVIEIPEHSRLTGTPDYIEADVHQPPEVRKLMHRKMALMPLVRKTYVELPPPSLSDNQSDLQRLEHGLKDQFKTQGFQMGLKVTRHLPGVLRKADWKVTAMTGHRGPLTEIIDIEPGKTARRNMCIAADIGTTTVVCHLVDLCDGQTLGK